MASRSSRPGDRPTGPGLSNFRYRPCLCDDFTLAMDTSDGIIRVRLGGDLDVRTGLLVTAALAGLRDHARGATASCCTALLDLSAVTFMDTAGLTAVTDALPALTRQGWTVRVIAANANVGRLLDFAVRVGWLSPAVRYPTPEPAVPHPRSG